MNTYSVTGFRFPLNIALYLVKDDSVKGLVAGFE